MRERERLEDFRGGHVACRGCKRLLFFDTKHMATPLRCCDIAYVPTRTQIDLIIYDRLGPDDFAEAIAQPPPPPVEVSILGEEVIAEDETEEVAVNDAEVDDMVATAAQIKERTAERMAQLRARRRPR